MPQLLLMRHAKSAYPEGVADNLRPLSPRGRADARAAGQWIAAAFPQLDEVVVSPALRAQQTWEIAREPLDARLVRTDARIYADWGDRLEDVVTELHHHTSTALIIGHNPGVESWALGVTAGGDDDARERMAHKFPTSGIAVLQWSDGWSTPRDVRLLAFAVPRG
jgi:phosphohistidine phosphatase